MKNIHLLPTEKPSRLFNCFGKLEIGDYVTTRENLQVTNQHIYITSDEEIKEGDYFIESLGLPDSYLVHKLSKEWKDKESFYRRCTKVILTTDQDLIKDGVQAIYDEFLEWFIKNPSCEEVEVNKQYSDFTVDPFVGYKIIIPKEEPKQETLEEAAESYVKNEPARTFKVISKYSFKAGAEWQQERMYSEEDMIAFAKFSQSDEYELHSVNRGLLSEFNKTQFKKK